MYNAQKLLSVISNQHQQCHYFDLIASGDSQLNVWEYSVPTMRAYYTKYLTLGKISVQCAMAYEAVTKQHLRMYGETPGEREAGWTIAETQEKLQHYYEAMGW